MIFVDKVDIKITAGKGGDGKLSFRHEIYIAKGGPDGGDGGNGGNIIFEASRNQNTLTAFRYKKEIKAYDGTAGGPSRKHGRTGKDLIVQVPVGTVISSRDKKIQLADLVVDGQKAVIAQGGNGGYGNAHFISSVRQAPNFAEKGEPGEVKELSLELKMIADVGLVGLPNAGKSTFLAKVSNARPEIADYPFTTLTPNLGVADLDKTSTILIADIPGLIEGAADGKGLGHDFLRHIERTAVILHLIDSYNDNIGEVYQTVRKELEAYGTDLSKRPEVVALTKIEGLDKEIINDHIATLKRLNKKLEVYAISSLSGENLKPLLYDLAKIIEKEKKKIVKKVNDQSLPEIILKDQTDKWDVEKTDKGFIVRGLRIEKFASRTDFGNTHGVQRLKDIMRRQGIMHELRRKGIESNDLIQFGDHEDRRFNY